MRSCLRTPGVLFLLVCFLSAFSLFFPLPSLNAETQTIPPHAASVDRPAPEANPIFPKLYFTENLRILNEEYRAKPYWVSVESELQLAALKIEDYTSLLLNNDVLAYYGSPLSKRMGILGALPKEELYNHLASLAAEYDEVNGERGVRTAFYLIYGTVWPEGEIGILKDSIIREYIDFALERDILIFLDHQIGRYDVSDSLSRMLPYLRYPNVHLAIDPEWRTDKPMEEIGSIHAEELNAIQELMEAYILEHGIPGERMLVVHQFNWRMISNREQVRTNFSRVRLVHCADGFGVPAVKRQSYEYNALAGNIPVKGFKLFYDSGIEGAGFDKPLMKPEEVLSLNPRPYLVIYQ